MSIFFLLLHPGFLHLTDHASIFLDVPGVELGSVISLSNEFTQAKGSLGKTLRAVGLLLTMKRTLNGLVPIPLPLLYIDHLIDTPSTKHMGAGQGSRNPVGLVDVIGY